MTKPKPIGKIYISGPMTGLPDFNYPAFDKKAREYREVGWEVENPAEHFGGDTGRPRRDYLEVDFASLAECGAIHFLPGWQNSAGARVEYLIAQEYGLKMYGEKEPPAELEANRLVRNGARQAVYGHPRDDFNRTAKMWSGLLGVDVTAHQVALMMGMLKMSRLASTPDHRDSVVDLIGYAICYDRLGEPE